MLKSEEESETAGGTTVYRNLYISRDNMKCVMLHRSFREADTVSAVRRENRVHLQICPNYTCDLREEAFTFMPYHLLYTGRKTTRNIQLFLCIYLEH